MARLEHWREPLSQPPTPEQLATRDADGWRLVAVEWQREVQGPDQDLLGLAGELPYGLRLTVQDEAQASVKMAEDRRETDVLRLVLEMIRDDEASLRAVAEELNRRGFRTRGGAPWTQVDLFELMPRVVEAAPGIYARQAPPDHPPATTTVQTVQM